MDKIRTCSCMSISDFCHIFSKDKLQAFSYKCWFRERIAEILDIEPYSSIYTTAVAIFLPNPNVDDSLYRNHNAEVTYKIKKFFNDYLLNENGIYLEDW